MQIILAIFVGGIAYLLFQMFFNMGTQEDNLITKRLDQIAKMGDVLGEEIVIKKQPLIVKMMNGSVEKLVTYLGTILPITSKEKERMEQLILQGGLKMTSEEYVAFQIIAIMFGGLIGIAFSLVLRSNIISGFAVGIFGGYTLFRYYIKKRIKERKHLIRKQLPETVDLLTLCVESGLSFNQGMQYALQKSEGPLINEFGIALKRMNLGESRRLALESLAQHCSIEEVTVFTSSVVQAEELGLPLRDVLVTQAQQGRIVRRMKIEEEAQKLPVKIMFPLVFLILPTLFVIILGPAVPQFLELFKSM